MKLQNIVIFHSIVLGLLCTLPVQATTGPDEATQALIDELGLQEYGEPLRNLSWWSKPDKVHISVSGGAQNPQRLESVLASAREVAGDVELVPVTGRLDQDTISTMEVYLGNCTPRIVREAVNLRWLQDSRHGVDGCMIPEINESNFILSNTQHTSGPPIAEHVIAMMMAMTRGLHFMLQAKAQRAWIRRSIDFPVIEISGKTLFVVGLGGIGTEVAKRANGLGMRVIGLRNSSREGPDFVEYVGLSHELYDLAMEADVIVNSLPLTDDTRDLFDERFFDSVKPGAYFISIGRGESTVTADLIAALKEGRLASAGLDVTDPEPLPPEHELWSLPNVIITPHMSSTTDRDIDRRWLVMRENLRRYINGERLLNVVDT
ncbi:MAG: D-2-hydroxyacid dehydrogenase, partial [Pseudomonadales bacterium]